MKTMDNHFVALATAKSGEPFTYYSGACWSMSGRRSISPKTNLEWKAYLNKQSKQLKNPLKVVIK
jgi:hypothetical protein